MSEPVIMPNAYNYGYYGISGDSGKPTVNGSAPGVFRNGEKRSIDRMGSDFQYGRDGGPFSRMSFPGAPEWSSPMIQRDTMGWVANRKVVYHVINREFSKDIMYPPQRYQMIMVKKDRKSVDISKMRQRNFKRRDILLNIPAWNYVQHLKERNYGPDDVIPTAEEIMENWTFGGIVVSEEGQQGEKEIPGHDIRRDRLTNFCVDGYTPTFCPSSRINAMTKGFLILKKEVRDGRYCIEANGNGDKFVDGIGRERTHKPFQLSFYADSLHDYPPDSVLMYEDEHGKRCRGIAIYVGVFERGVQPKDIVRKGDFSTSIMALTTQPLTYLVVSPRFNKF